MSNSFQQSFVHLVAANNALNGLPRLQPAPTALPTGLTQTSPPSLHLPTLPLSVLQPAPGAASPPTPPPLDFSPLAPPAPASTTTLFEFIDSVRGKPKLLHDGYLYTHHATRSNGFVAWRCEHNNKAERDNYWYLF